ncbi:hypothetical protein K461DRAFT_2146 [Myriangium duriaei CBS 260.36]|uniref:Secreted protein n=1 Tax=Myriangium duriaei CBS 260.36 TaxID=1168546 RepID=A0A9P4MRK6_9PEZI|nr:hypothetical protein K461DRAFT_2146 [Myriangium duriaei CBS 260.36]
MYWHLILSTGYVVSETLSASVAVGYSPMPRTNRNVSGLNTVLCTVNWAKRSLSSKLLEEPSMQICTVGTGRI